MIRSGPGARRLATALALVLLLLGVRPALADKLVLDTGTGRHVLSVEIAADQESRERGLMFRRELAPGAGMLFEFDQDQPVLMWMKNTYVPLDILFISADGSIVNIARNTKPLSLDTVASDGLVRAALELKAGTADRLGIAPGAKVLHPFFGNAEAHAQK